MEAENSRPVLRASHGELVFDDEIEPAMRETIRRMWVNRLAGFHQRDIRRYLCDNVETSRFLRSRRWFSLGAFRTLIRALFSLQRVGAVAGVTLTAEVLDLHVRREGERYAAQGVVLLMLAGRVLRQSELTMLIVSHGGRWVWEQAIDERLPRTRWPYFARATASGETEFTRTAPRSRS